VLFGSRWRYGQLRRTVRAPDLSSTGVPRPTKFMVLEEPVSSCSIEMLYRYWGPVMD
jgi:hypothetical protein